MQGMGVQSDMGMFNNSDNNVPGVSHTAVLNNPEFKPENYRVRVQRFVIGGEDYACDTAMLENLWTEGMDPKQDGIVILENKQFTNNDQLVVVVTFLEHRTKVVHWRIGREESQQEFPTAEQLIKNENKA